jgi:hypothetical protein
MMTLLGACGDNAVECKKAPAEHDVRSHCRGYAHRHVRPCYVARRMSQTPGTISDCLEFQMRWPQQIKV